MHLLNLFRQFSILMLLNFVFSLFYIYHLFREVKTEVEKSVHEVKNNLFVKKKQIMIYSFQVPTVGAMVRGRVFTERKPPSFNKLWTEEEQRRLENLLIEYPVKILP